MVKKQTAARQLFAARLPVRRPAVKTRDILSTAFKTGKRQRQAISFTGQLQFGRAYFSTDYADLIPDNYLLSPDQIRDAGAKLNKQNAKGVYTSMGFAPRWIPEFLYQTAKLNGADFSESSKQRSSFGWNQSALDKTVEYLRAWTSGINTSTPAEDDYQFKYLYNPHIKWVTEKHCLFAYITSDTLFCTAPEKLQDVDFRWIRKDEKLPVEDDMVSMGMYKYAKTRLPRNFLLSGL